MGSYVKSSFSIDSILKHHSEEEEEEEDDQELNVEESEQEELDEDFEDTKSPPSEDHDEESQRSEYLSMSDDGRRHEGMFPVLKPLPIYSALQIPPGTSHLFPGSAAHSAIEYSQLCVPNFFPFGNSFGSSPWQQKSGSLLGLQAPKPSGRRVRKPGLDRKPRQAYSAKQLEKLESEFK
ncbi:unnamed protein product, partial [Allacma fusca]